MTREKDKKRKIWAVALQELRFMITDSKIIILLFLSFFFIEIFGGGVRRIALAYNWKIAPWLLPCLLQTPFFLNCISILIVFLFSEMPIRGQEQFFLLSRTGYQNWCLGQFLALVIMGTSYLFFLFLCSILVILPCISLKQDWGKLYDIYMQSTNIEMEKYKLIKIDDSSVIFYNFQPLKILLLSMLLVWLLCILYGSFLFLINGIANNYVGIIILSIASFADIFFNNVKDNVIFQHFQKILLVYWIHIEHISFDRIESYYWGNIVFIEFLVIMIIGSFIYFLIRKRKIFY